MEEAMVKSATGKRADIAREYRSMPSFDLISMEEAMVKSATGKRADIAREYLGFIEQLRSGWAGKLQAGEGESITAVRRRLTSAAKFAGRSIVSKRVDDEACP